MSSEMEAVCYLDSNPLHLIPIPLDAMSWCADEDSK